MRLAARDRRERLIEAATRLFSVQGFDGTTTREIAEAAGVSEAIIFRHFAKKEDLYWAVISERIRVAGRKEKIQHYLTSGGNAAEVFAGIAETLLKRNPEDVILSRLLLFSALRNDDLAERFFRTYLAEAFDSLADYIRDGIEDGEFRDVDPAVAARSFLGTIAYHNLVQEVFGGNRHQQFDPRILGRQITDAWLNGISVSNKPANKGSRDCHPTKKDVLERQHAGSGRI